MSESGSDMDAFIREYLAYDPSSHTGLRWIKNSSSRGRAGNPAFTAKQTSGYYVGACRKKLILAHRVVFFLVHGEWPTSIDHVDGNPLNNNVENLRPVTPSENMHNQIRKGFWFSKRDGRYQARINLDGKRINLGCYGSENEARSAYLEAKRRLHPSAPERCYDK